jgi:hypothetical protein
MQMSDGSVILYNIDITLNTRREDMIADRQVTEFCGRSIDPIEKLLVHLLCDRSEEEEDDQSDDDSIDDGDQGDSIIDEDLTDDE